ncbi:hypothetical protein CCMA1212_010023 [Trichoderma ghanense]|uniref:Uncharacterized protein n=1 Tax=Trichoderma ghanense TaxID=65468 RepID=A0ABY2GQH4_9HYPO
MAGLLETPKKETASAAAAGKAPPPVLVISSEILPRGCVCLRQIAPSVLFPDIKSRTIQDSLAELCKTVPNMRLLAMLNVTMRHNSASFPPRASFRIQPFRLVACQRPPYLDRLFLDTTTIGKALPLID